MNKKIELLAKLTITYVIMLGICFLLYSYVVIPTNGAEKINAITGLLGWSATIFAPIAAYFFLNSWKEQTQYNSALEKIEEMLEQITFLVNQIEEIRNKQDVFLFLNNYLTNKNGFDELCKSSEKRFDLPSFTDIYKTLENIRVINLKILLLGEEINTHVFESKNDDIDSFSKLESCIKGLDASYILLRLNKNIAIELQSSDEWLHRFFYVSNIFYKSYISTIDPSAENKHLVNLNKAIDSCFDDLKKYRINLE
ncbi:hypothetical protein ACG93R_05290 [Acinetobacter guillouiae]|uniref:hypothetical protein n=1 Tax=Acinetobacter guillouiae TaxID=106649 RepID=UPI003AF64CB2